MLLKKEERMRLYVPLRQSEFEQLIALARSERRRPQDQAALLIARALPSDDLARQVDPGLEVEGDEEAAGERGA